MNIYESLLSTSINNVFVIDLSSLHLPSHIAHLTSLSNQHIPFSDPIHISYLRNVFILHPCPIYIILSYLPYLIEVVLKPKQYIRTPILIKSSTNHILVCNYISQLSTNNISKLPLIIHTIL